jgi:hypothetical protein
LKEEIVFIDTLIDEILRAIFSEVLCTQAGGRNTSKYERKRIAFIYNNISHLFCYNGFEA